MTAFSRARPGVTMIELIIVTAILVGLAGVVLVVIDAPGRLEGAVVSQEKVNAEAITKALQLSMVDNFGLIESVQPLTPGEERDICKPGVFDDSCVNLDKLVEDGYLAQIPVQKDLLDDPEALITGYKVVRESAYLSVRSRNTEGIATTGGGGGNGGGGVGGNDGGGTGDTGDDGGGGGGTQDYQLTAWNNYSPNPAWLDTVFVTDTVTVNGITYVGGHFDNFMVQTGRVTAIDKNTGIPVPATFVGKPSVNGNSSMTAGDIVPDGNGGWFFAGNFSSVSYLMGSSDTSYDEIIHVLSDGSISSWKPVFEGESTAVNVHALDYDPVRQILIAVGNFSDGYGEPINLMAFDMANGGAVIPWNPGVNGPILDAKIIGDTIFLAGAFTSVNGTPREFLAAFDLSGEVPVLLPWNPAPTGSINTLHQDGNTLYVGGFLGAVNDGVNGGGAPVTRLGIAAFDISDMESITLTPWTAGAMTLGFNGGVRAIRADSSRVYIGGQFTSVGGQARTHLAALNKSTGAVDPWNPVLTVSPVGGATMVRTLVLDNGTLYAGGNFQIAGTHPYAAAFDMSGGGSMTSWNPGFGNEVMALNVDANNVYAVGKFIGVLKPRQNLIAFDANGRITDWNPGLTHDTEWALVTGLKTDGTRLFVSGNFNTVAGQTRANLASFDLATGALNSWNPGSPTQTSIEVHDGYVYVTGENVTQNLDKLVRIGTTNGIVDASFTPEPNSPITSIAFDGSDIYVGGGFAVIGGQSREGLAKLDQTGVAQPWNPVSNGDVHSLHVNGSTLYAGGTFTSIDGEARSRAASFNLSDGELTSWAPSVSFPVRVMKRNGSMVYIAGDQVDQNPFFIAVDAGNASVLPWSAKISNDLMTNAAVGDIEFNGDNMYIGGYFLTDYSQQGNPLIYSLLQYKDF